MHDEAQLLEILIANPWFASLPAEVRRQLVTSADLRHYKSGELIFRQGDPSIDFCGLLQGAVRISSLRRDGKEAILSVLEQGVWFGEIGLIDLQPRTHDARATCNTSLLHVPPAAFTQLRQHSAFESALLLMMASRLRQTYRMMEDATLRSPRARVAHRLLLLARGDAAMETAARHSLSVDQESLAMMLGITRQTLSKVLKGIAAQGAIALGYRRIDICSTEILNQLALDT